MKKRQEVGRGLRIAVNQEGERVFGFEVNRLTIMANESYEEFAKQLQKEIEQDTGIKFGVVEKHLFAGIPTVTEACEPGHLGVDSRTECGITLGRKVTLTTEARCKTLFVKPSKTRTSISPKKLMTRAHHSTASQGRRQPEHQKRWRAHKVNLNKGASSVQNFYSSGTA